MRPAPVQTELEKPKQLTETKQPKPLPSTNRNTEPVDADGASSAPLAKPPASPTKSRSFENVRAATFQGITPGHTSATELLKTLGEPKSKQGAGQAEWVYEISNFRKVVFLVQKDRVSSAIVHLAEAAPESQIATQLDLVNFEPFFQRDHAGHVTATCYPERGVLLRRASQTSGDLVHQIVLQPIHADLFLARAEQPERVDFSQIIADIEYAQKLDPQNAHAYWLHAEILSRIGRPTLGAAAAERAVLLSPQNLRYQLTYADLIGRIGNDLEALTLTKKVRDTAPPNVFERALAENQLGHWTAFGRRANYQQAVKNHRRAMAIANELLADAPSVEHPDFWRLLIDAHCAAAMSLSVLDTEDKTTQVTTTLDDAQRLIDGISNQKAMIAELQWKIDYARLYTAMNLETEVALKPIADRVVHTVTQLSQNHTDDIYVRHGSYHAGLTLYAVAVLAKDKASKEDVRSYIEAACKLMEEGSLYRDKTSDYKYQRGRTLYFAGAVHALLFQDHATAVTWYDRALEFMKSDLPPSHETDLALQGERLVRMGVSYWSQEQRAMAIQVTRAGMKMTEDAVKRQSCEEDALAIPYGNLASMYGQVGNVELAKKYDQLAAELAQ